MKSGGRLSVVGCFADLVAFAVTTGLGVVFGFGLGATTGTFGFTIGAWGSSIRVPV